MQAVILAAGYATRLYPITLNRAKPLLPVGDQPIINYIIDGLVDIPEITKVCVVTNNKFYRDFRRWRRESSFKKDIVIINDGTNSDNDKLGALGDIELVINRMSIDDDLIVIAGDNLFGFELKDFVDFFKKNGLSIACYKSPYQNELSRYGIVELDGNNRVIRFQEKPKEPMSDLVAVCLYGFPRDKLGVIKEYVEGGNNRDAPGYYIEWLVKMEKVYSFIFNAQWHDIGTPDSYERAQREFEEVLMAPRGGS